MNKKEQYIKIFANFLLLATIIFLCIKFVPFVIGLFMPFIVSYIIFILAEPAVDFLEKSIKLKRKFSGPFVILLIIILLGFSIYFLFSQLYDFIYNITDNWNDIFLQINNVIQKIDEFLLKFNINIENSNLSGIISKFASSISKEILDYTSSFVLNVPMLIFTIVITLMAANYLIQDNGKTTKLIFDKYKSLGKLKTQVIDQSLKYLKAQFKIMLIIFIVLAGLLSVLKIGHAIPLAFIISFIDLLPILGTGTIMIPWSVIELIMGDYFKGICLFGVYLIAMILRQFLQPKIIGKTMEFPSFLTLVVMYVGYKLYGIVGLLFSVPVGVVLLRIYQAGMFDIYINSIKLISKDFKNFLKIKF